VAESKLEGWALGSISPVDSSLRKRPANHT
jgi:hypothetical protein